MHKGQLVQVRKRTHLWFHLSLHTRPLLLDESYRVIVTQLSPSSGNLPTYSKYPSDVLRKLPRLQVCYKDREAKRDGFEVVTKNSLKNFLD